MEVGAIVIAAECTGGAANFTLAAVAVPMLEPHPLVSESNPRVHVISQQ